MPLLIASTTNNNDNIFVSSYTIFPGPNYAYTHIDHRN
jgi:hypothetical protein